MLLGAARPAIQGPTHPGGPAGDSAGPVSIETGRTRRVLHDARAAMVASGSATVETALIGCPMVICYKISWLTYFLGRMLIRVPHIGMVNIIAGRGICPEFIQNHATPAALAGALEPLLGDTPERAAMLQGLAGVRDSLGEAGGAGRAADLILADLQRRSVRV